jgi:YfiH family protein
VRGILPKWPAPTWVRAITTTRMGGVSKGSFDNFNLGLHVFDNPNDVARNRLELSQTFNFMYEPQWLNQTHSTHVIELKTPTQKHAQDIDADGAYTQLTGVPCVILTADCLPLLLCDTTGKIIGAVHCGWRGIANGIIENALNAIRLNTTNDILAWLGPAIGQNHFEVGDEVRDQFLKHNLSASNAFIPGKQPGKWMANLYTLASMRLREMGVKQIYGGDYCTYTDANQFYSYRRDKETGRMATLIWLALS